MTEINSPNDTMWKKLQDKALSDCANGDHQFIEASDNCIICGKTKEVGL